MKIEKNSVVHFRYRMQDSQGNTLEDALGEPAVAILQGAGNVIPGLDRGLLGHEQGDCFEIVVAPEWGYGMPKENDIQRLSKKYFQNPNRLKPGMRTSLSTKDGARSVTVKKVGSKVIDVDMNHPLAGQHLHFTMEIDGVREATNTEISHRHAHAEGQEHH